MKKFDLLKLSKLKLIDPCNYFDFLSLQKNAKIVLTDSGGIQEETTILKTPCITIRKNTERPETVKAGMNILTSYSLNRINNAIQKSLNKKILWKNIYGKNVSNKIFKIIKKDYEKIKSKIFYILPCYNEELNLNKLLKDFINFYRKKKN